MRVLISGRSGLVGSALAAHWSTPSLDGRTAGGPPGYEIGSLVRPGRAPGPNDVPWDPAGESIDVGRLDGWDAVVHLAGESIAERRWTAAQKERIRRSRVQGTSLLANALARSPRPPRVVVAASAIGYYGARGDEWVDESSPPGEGFLAETCVAWEAAARPLADAGIRVVHLRIGIVQSPKGGALAEMLPIFRWGLGGQLGHGRQWFSWISLPDLVAAIDRAVADDRLRGPVNAVAPHPVTNAEFTRTLASVLRRPAWFTVPSLAVRLMFGEMADEALLTGVRVRPGALLDTGFTFAHPTLREGLEEILRTGNDAR